MSHHWRSRSNGNRFSSRGHRYGWSSLHIWRNHKSRSCYRWWPPSSLSYLDMWRPHIDRPSRYHGPHRRHVVSSSRLWSSRGWVLSKQKKYLLRSELKNRAGPRLIGITFAFPPAAVRPNISRHKTRQGAVACPVGGRLAAGRFPPSRPLPSPVSRRHTRAGRTGVTVSEGETPSTVAVAATDSPAPAMGKNERRKRRLNRNNYYLASTCGGGCPGKSSTSLWNLWSNAGRCRQSSESVQCQYGCPHPRDTRSRSAHGCHGVGSRSRRRCE